MNNVRNLEAAPTVNAKFRPEAVIAVSGRLLIAAIFLLSGLNKVTNPAANVAYIESAALPFPQLALAVGIVVELVGGVLLVAGYRVRMVALGLAVFTLAAALGFHLDFADQNQFLHFFKNVAMAGGLLQIAAFGGGRYSIGTRQFGDGNERRN